MQEVSLYAYSEEAEEVSLRKKICRVGYFTSINKHTFTTY